MVGRRESSLRLICITCLIGGVLSLPMKGFRRSVGLGSASDFSSPGSVYWVGQDALVSTSGSTPQDASGTALQHYGALNDGGVYSNDDSYTAAGNSGWVKNGGLDSGSDAYDPLPEFLTSKGEDLEQSPEEEAVLSDVSDLDPVYSFSSRSRYVQGRKVFSLSHYMPGEVMDLSNGKGKPVGPRQPVKAGY